MVSLNQSVDGDAFVLGIGVALSRYHEGNLGRLEVEVKGREDSDNGHSRVSIHIGAVLGFNITVEVALGNSVDVDVRKGQVRRDSDDELAVGEHVGLGQVVSEPQSDLKRTCLPHWQFNGLNHGVQSHLTDVSRGLIDADSLLVLFDQSSMAPECRNDHVVVGIFQGSPQGDVEGELAALENGREVLDVDIGVSGPIVGSGELSDLALGRVDPLDEQGILQEVSPIAPQVYFDVIPGFQVGVHVNLKDVGQSVVAEVVWDGHCGIHVLVLDEDATVGAGRVHLDLLQHYYAVGLQYVHLDVIHKHLIVRVHHPTQ